MNDKQRKGLMIASILGVISIGVTSLSFSYAWYASSSRVEVSGVDIYIRSERNLRLSPTVDGEYKLYNSNDPLDLGKYYYYAECFGHRSKLMK